MKVGRAVKQLHDAELDLAERYRAIGGRHPSDHDVYHQTRTFAKQCVDHANKLQPIAGRYGDELEPEEEPKEGLVDTLRAKTGALLGRRPESGLLLLRDLRELYLDAQETLIMWVIVHQGAMAARDTELLGVVSECNLETELQVKWFVTRIKVTAPQVLMS
jgi:hypothetical protein